MTDNNNNLTDELINNFDNDEINNYINKTLETNNIFNENDVLTENNNFDELHNNKNNFDDIQNYDPWDDSINDNQFIVNNKIMRIFPQLKNPKNYLNLKIDDESLSFITIREIADLTSKIICHHLIKFNLNPQKVKIIDYTAGVGGNVLSFSKYFNKVYAIEIQKNRYEYLINNINVYEYNNIFCINDSSINFNEKFLVEINPNVIFVDPPWGGNGYKENDSLRLKLGDVSVENLVIDIFSKLYENIIKKENLTIQIGNKKLYKTNIFHNKFVVLKLPKNYDIEYFYETIKNHNIPNYTINSYLYILNKMLIIVCEFFSISD
jgi:16S rRNA G966 N2-methylase RsmD